MKSLKHIRKQLGLSQEHLGVTLNVSQQTIAKWENGTANPRTEKLPEIAKALNCEIADLFEEV